MTVLNQKVRYQYLPETKKSTNKCFPLDPCALVDCGPNKTCITAVSPCLIQPCPVRAKCVPTLGEYQSCRYAIKVWKLKLDIN